MSDPMSELDLALHREVEPHKPGGHHRKREPRGRSAIAFAVVAVVLALVAGAAIYGVQQIAGFFNAPDYTGNGHGSVTVQIEPGDTAAAIGETLESKDVVKSAKAFINAAKDNPKSRSVQPGSYRLHQQMQASAALTLLLDPSSRLLSRVTIPEGLTVEQILQRVADSTDIPLADLQAAVKKPGALGLPAWAGGQVEGFLFPATYDVEPGTSATEVLKTMVAKFTAVADEMGLTAKAQQVHISAHDAVVVASLVEKEGRVRAEDPKIARVIYNRLNRDMPLQVDAAVLYGVGKSGEGTAPTQADLNSDSPYNTYRHKGLPPTPIASPGKAALQAALAPAHGPWLYYVLEDKQGHHFFTDNYQEFLQQKAESKRQGVF